jgi:hypothetical protein
MQADNTDAVVHLTLPRSLRRALKRAAAESDSTIREIARRALSEYLERQSGGRETQTRR